MTSFDGYEENKLCVLRASEWVTASGNKPDPCVPNANNLIVSWDNGATFESAKAGTFLHHHEHLPYIVDPVLPPSLREFRIVYKTIFNSIDSFIKESNRFLSITPGVDYVLLVIEYWKGVHITTMTIDLTDAAEQYSNGNYKAVSNFGNELNDKLKDDLGYG